jgi:hypothetical protein
VSEVKDQAMDRIAASSQQDRSFMLEIFSVALAAILLEIAYTRIFSFKVYYYFTYVILGMGLLGLGSGGVLLAVSQRLRKGSARRIIAASCALGSASVLLGYVAIALIPLNVSELTEHPAEIAKLVAVCSALVPPFLAVGLVISRILSARPERIARLYGADLIGAALACLLAIPLLGLLTPPGCVMLAGAVLALAGVRAALPNRGLAGLAGLLALTLGAASVGHRTLPDPVVDRVKQLDSVRDAGLVLFSRWSPVFRVDVAHHPLQPEAGHMIYHDGQLGSGLPAFDGDLSKFEKLERGSRSLPFSVLPPRPKVLVIGSAGGQEILASLYFGADRVTAVELNPVTVSLLTHHFIDFTGRIAQHPKVQLVNAEGRSFLENSSDTFDLVWLVAPDSYAAMNAASSGAFVLTESYLYTVEMLHSAFAHLAPGGIVAAQFGERDYARKPNRTARYLATAREALAQQGTSDFPSHALVATGQAFPPFSEATVLIAPEPFSAERQRAFLANAPSMGGGQARFVQGAARDPGPVGDVITLPDERLARWFDGQPYDLRPVRDDSPFFWHFVRFRDSLRARPALAGLGVDWEDSIGEQVLLILLATVTLLAAALLLLPFVALPRLFSEIPHKGRAMLYFASLGLGFMLFEVCLIQMLTLFLGYPTYSLSVTLFGILIFSGLGALASERRQGGALIPLIGVLALLVIAYRIGIPLLPSIFGSASLAVRMGIAVIAIAPLGFCLGHFMPIGLRALAGTTTHPQEYVAWCWAVNGFFSVIASVASTILAMILGFQGVLLLALAVYFVGAVAVLGIPGIRVGRSPA